MYTPDVMVGSSGWVVVVAALVVVVTLLIVVAAVVVLTGSVVGLAVVATVTVVGAEVVVVGSTLPLLVHADATIEATSSTPESFPISPPSLGAIHPRTVALWRHQDRHTRREGTFVGPLRGSAFSRGLLDWKGWLDSHECSSVDRFHPP